MSDWSADVCASDLRRARRRADARVERLQTPLLVVARDDDRKSGTMHGRAALAAHDARVIGVRAVYPFGKRAGAATEIALPRFLKQPPYICSALATASAARSAARTRIRCAASWTSRSIVLVWKIGRAHV